mgnify:FL=1|tara:strand:+ start:175 stop:2142 length:1968 start_codon:yes stop_codon:yes gene_type:complete
MENKKLTSVIDVPREAGQADLFGIDKYKDALVEFIGTTTTPITVAIQGEWGSGKTSLMNTLKDELCDQEGKKFHPIWLNTWQYSLMKSEEETLISIINGLTNEIAEIATEKDSSLEKLAKKSLSILSRIAGASVKVAVSATTGQRVDEVVDALSNDARDTTILKLRDSLNELISSIIETDDKDGFLFFIDDLDRIDPPVAVNILELLKNIFDLDNCVFILAIDYDVVVKGLEPKFGKLTEKNEREFRSFFDKIIQLPFSMPVTSYNIDVFLEDTLTNMGYVPNDVTIKNEFFKNLTEIAYNSVGSNPRSLKRLVNTLSLISIINRRTGLDKGQSDIDKQVNFALVCLQVAYPSIYKAVNLEPNFIHWSEDMAIKLKLRKLEEHESIKLKSSEEFDEEWEQVLYRICERDTYLERRAFNISALLNKINDLALSDTSNELGEYISVLLELSSVTDVQAFDKPRIISNRTEAAGNLLESLYKFIPEKIEEPIIEIGLPSLKVNLNRELWCRTKIKGLDEKPGIGVLISPKENKVSVKVRANIPLKYEPYQGDGSKLLSIVSSENIKYLQQVDKDLEKICEKFGYQAVLFSENNIRISKNKDWINSKIQLIKKYNHIEEFNSSIEYEKLSEIMVKIGLIIAQTGFYCTGKNTEYNSINL